MAQDGERDEIQGDCRVIPRPLIPAGPSLDRQPGFATGRSRRSIVLLRNEVSIQEDSQRTACADIDLCLTVPAAMDGPPFGQLLASPRAASWLSASSLLDPLAHIRQASAGHPLAHPDAQQDKVSLWRGPKPSSCASPLIRGVVRNDGDGGLLPPYDSFPPCRRSFDRQPGIDYGQVVPPFAFVKITSPSSSTRNVRVVRASISVSP